MANVEKTRRIWKALITFLVALVSTGIMAVALVWAVTHIGVPGSTLQSEPAKLAIMDRYDMQMTNTISNALDGILTIEKVYWLNDDDQIAPEPNQDHYLYTTDPGQLQDFLDRSAELLKGQTTLFTPQTPLLPGSQAICYLDETIMNITWKQEIHGSVYTISEVKIAHPSQFRRFLADGTYGSDKQYQTTEMAATVNAVTASSGDFYKFRKYGITVYNGEVYKTNSQLDTCFITDTGEMLFSRIGELNGEEAVKAFVEENHVRFSLSFGPVLIDNFEVCTPNRYLVGEIQDRYARAALCYMGELHYLLVTSNQEPGKGNVPNIYKLSEVLQDFGCEKAYTLDGGQTAVIVTNDQLINVPTFGHQRLISDIIYFATAIPDGGQK